MNNLYVEQNGKWEGPFTQEMLRTFLAKGVVDFNTPARVGNSEKIRTVEFFTGAWAAPHFSPKQSMPDAKPAVTLLGIVAVVLVIGGVAGLVYFFGFYDVSVPVNSFGAGGFGWMPDRVNNIGLMQDRQNGIIVSCVVMLIGVILAVYDAVARRRS